MRFRPATLRLSEAWLHGRTRESARPGTGTGDRLVNLDALRGAAALCVAYSHLLLTVQARGQGDAASHFLFLTTKTYLDVGKAAVFVLFALSGYFLIGGLSALAARSDRPVTEFLWQRGSRLYPLYWVSLAGGALLPWDDPHRLFGPGVVALNATMLQGFFQVENVVPLYWTLQIEVTFYVLCVLILAFRPLARIRTYLALLGGLLAVAVGLAAARYATHVKLPVALPLMLAVCVLGGIWRLGATGRCGASPRHGWLAVGLFLAALGPVCVLAYSRDYGFHETWYRYGISYCAGLATFIAATRIRRPVMPFLASLGGAGYALFLFHPTVYAFADRIGLHPSGLSLVYLALLLAAAVATAFALTALLSRPLSQYTARLGPTRRADAARNAA